jgi:crotonobetainyl-CoA:carnitine CoA-transferase CaiB-like acyl-CoA transferase
MNMNSREVKPAAPAGTPMPLAGVTVVEIAQNLAGPFCGEILASLGADVVKIERPGQGDDARGWGPPFVLGTSPSFLTLNANKRSVTLDLEDPHAREWLTAFIGERDIVLHNMRPGAMERLGLGSVALQAKYPQLIYGSISGFGNSGPLMDKPGYDAIVQAVAGVFAVNGDPQGRTARVGLSVLDLGSGLWTALGCIAALRRRDMTGRGCTVETSLFETALGWLTIPSASASITGQEPQRDRAGAPSIATYQCFATSDGEVLIAAANDRLFRKLATVLGKTSWLEDPDLRSNAGRLQHKETLSREIADILLKRTSREWEEELGAVGFPVASINGIQAMLRHPQTEAVGMHEPLEGTGMTMTRLPLSFDGERPQLRTRAPGLGEHNEELLPARLNQARA